jgi:Rod binding domain-containing protein
MAQRRLKLKKATQAFESIFIEQMLKSMRASSIEDKDKEESGFGKDIMMSIADEGVANRLSKSNMLGVGEVLYQHLLKRLKEDTGESTGLKITSQRHIDGIAPVRSTTYPELPQVGENSTAVDAARKYQPPIQGPVRISESSRPTGIERLSKSAESPTMKAQAYDRLDKYVGHIREAAKETDLPEELLRAVIMQESAGDQRATSHRGAGGLMQLMPDTARSVGVKNLYDAGENIMGGARYLRQMLDRFGNLETALAAYNAGPGSIEKHGGIPPFVETQEYVKRILSELSEAKQVNKSSPDTDIRK